MGNVARKVGVKLSQLRPRSCDPYVMQETKVLRKFDRVLKVLQMTPQHGRMFYALFSKIDVDFSGDVDIWEFADFYELTLSLFIQRLFKQLDMHNKGGLFFGEYLFSIWNLGTLSYKEMIVFVFNLYDEGRTGLLDQPMMRRVVLEMYELDLKVDDRIPNFLLRNVDLLFLSKKAKAQAPLVTIENFAKFCERYPEFLKPALSLQNEVVKKSLDAAFWKQARLLRQQLSVVSDPQSFYLYIKDLTEMGNEKSVTRKGGDHDSDLDGSGSDDDEKSGDDNRSGGGGHELGRLPEELLVTTDMYVMRKHDGTASKKKKAFRHQVLEKKDMTPKSHRGAVQPDETDVPADHDGHGEGKHSSGHDNAGDNDAKTRTSVKTETDIDAPKPESVLSGLMKSVKSMGSGLSVAPTVMVDTSTPQQQQLPGQVQGSPDDNAVVVVGADGSPVVIQQLFSPGTVLSSPDKTQRDKRHKLGRRKVPTIKYT